jgi:acyl-CoA synthetase (NDP forming)
MLRRPPSSSFLSSCERVNSFFCFNFSTFDHFLQILTQRRTLMLQENAGMTVLEKAGISVPKYGTAKTPDEAYKHAKKIGLLIVNCLLFLFILSCF